MAAYESRKRRERPPKRALDAGQLEELALAYVARFSTSAFKLSSYLRQKLHARGWEGEAEPKVDALVARFVERGYVDDTGYAKMRAHSLLQRGYGRRRVKQALYQAGIAEEISTAISPSEFEERSAAKRYAQRRRFGPFYAGEIDPERREKQLAAMVRAGHNFDHAKSVLEAADEDDIDDWVEDARDENG